MEAQIGYVSSLIGDPVRSKVLWMLLDGRAYTATELAVAADTTPQNMSMHLSKLLQADLLKVEKQGRHRYYRFSRHEIAYSIEAMANLIPVENRRKLLSNPGNAAVRHCRTCYDHLAGRVGVALNESLLKQQLITAADNSYLLTTTGEEYFTGLGVSFEVLKKQKRALVKPCLDWSERKHHLAGSLGAALLQRMLELDWMRRMQHSRAVVVTAKGQHALYERFAVML